ncbi:hypothetical protein ABGB17_35870 [Sphaerisporangium sp. B11E5]|uniref:hypothetical protein n=1 Tax=Sphaerisporangium sp. B11E5 TaxID=3153563 RepID=UPI00325E75CB
MPATPFRPSPAALLAGVAALYGAAQLVIVSPALGIGWDEAIYAGQFAAHAPPPVFSAPRAQGVPLLVAPVTALTDSILVLRLYLAAVSSLALFGAFLIWVRVRPGHTAPLAALLFGGCWLSLFYGIQAMPNLYVALGAVAATGLVCLRRRSLPVLAGLAAVFTVVSLMRPSDALALAVPVAAAALLSRGESLGHRVRPVVAVATGVAVGWGQWLIEAQLRFGGVPARLTAAGDANRTGLTFSLLEHARALDGPSLCRWDIDCGPISPVAVTWALAIPLMTVAGLWASRHDRFPLVLATVTAAVTALPYLLYVDYAAPRFLMPAYALLALPIAAGVLTLPSRLGPLPRRATTAIVTAGLLAHFALQGTYAHGMSTSVGATRDRVRLATEELRRLGVEAPCMVYGEAGVEIGYMLGCGSQGLAVDFPRRPPPRVRKALDSGTRLVLVYVTATPPPYTRGWHTVELPGRRTARFSPAWGDLGRPGTGQTRG